VLFPRLAQEVLDLLPNLGDAYIKTSERDEFYNCAAHAAEDDLAWWWPRAEPEYYWPAGARLDRSLDAFAEGFGLLGYQRCDTVELEEGYQKVAVYAVAGSPKHIARQLADGRWTSKLGHLEDIAHATLDSLESAYGAVALVMRRPRVE
jgi:hypothetical protein